MSILLLLWLGVAVPLALVWTLSAAALLLWGGVVVGVGAGNLVEAGGLLRPAWVALSVGAYGALAVPGVVRSPGSLVEALGPVAALTLAAHLGRRDLPAALHDWAVLIGLALYFSVGTVAMWAVVSGFRDSGPAVFLVAVLFPPLVFEAALLLLRRVGAWRGSSLPHVLALVLATALAALAVSVTLLNRSTPVLWAVIFGLIAGLLIGGALLVSLLTRPMIEAAAGVRDTRTRFEGLGRAMVELTHGPVLISLAVYFVLRVLNIAS